MRREVPENEPKPRALEAITPGSPLGWKAVLKNGKQVVVHEIPATPAAAAAAIPRLQRLAEHPHPSLSPVLAWGTEDGGVWVAVEHAPDRHLTRAKARLNFIKSASGLVDLFAVMPFWLGLVVSADLRFLLVFRSPSARLMTMIPSLFAILSVFIVMRVAGIPLNIATMSSICSELTSSDSDLIWSWVT